MKDEIIITNKKNFEKKKKALINDGAKNLHIVTDFDRTLTKAFDKNKKTHSIIAQIREGKYLSPEYTKKAFALHAKYYPIEINPNLSEKEKTQKMEEWWRTHINLIAKSGMNKKICEDIAEKKIILREGAKKFLTEAAKKKIPTTVLSAALGDIIQMFLEKNKINSKNLRIISNFFDFDKEGNVKGYKGKIIHSMNKDEFEVKDKSFTKKLVKRKNVLLLGDRTEDVKMIKESNYENTIKICFMNEKTQAQIEEYKKFYDALVLNDGSMNIVNKILSEIK